MKEKNWVLSRDPHKVLDDYQKGIPLSAEENRYIRWLKDECPWMFVNYRLGGRSGSGRYQPPSS